MSSGAGETSVVVISAWRELGAFRARVTVTSDAETREDWTVVLVSPQDVADNVGAWAADVAAGRPLRRPPEPRDR